MRGGRALAIAAAGCTAAVALVACIDLFHSTDFETLRDGSVDAPTAEAAVDAGPKPLVDFCKWSPAEAKTHAARACAWLGSCTGVLGDTALGQCMVHASWAYDCDLNPGLRPNGATYALWSCLSDVKSCGEVDACIHPGGAQDVCPAATSGSFTQCGSGGPTELRVECSKAQGGAPSSIEPCALQGQSCISIDAGTSTCGGATKKNCAFGRSCTGSAAVDCRFAEDTVTLVDYGIDCAAFGSGACVSDEDGGDDGGALVGCAPLATAPACDGGLAVSCDVDGSAVARSCAGGKEIAIDCSKLGVGCDLSKPVSPSRPFEACAEYVDAGRCVGADSCVSGKLRSCARGIAFEADCVALGLGPCEQVGGSAIFRCKPP